MCSEDIDEITNTTLLTMEDYDEAFLVKGKEKIETSTQILFHVSKSRTNSHIVSGSSGTTLGEEEEEEEEEDRHRQGHENGSSSKVGPSLGGLLAGNGDEDEDESGFKTPSSPDHKIPGVTLCPGAPRKPKFHFSSRKRKASSSTTSLSSSPSPSRSPTRSSGVRRSLLLDLSQEVESLFPRPVLADTHRERKRARSGGGCGGGGGDH